MYDFQSAAADGMYRLMQQLYPVCRSITGDGVRETLRLVSEIVPLAITEVPTGTKVFDWTIPREWNIRDAYIKDASGRRVVDYSDHNLHVMSYSVPVNETLSLEELRNHLYTLPEHPEWIPYRTTYYNEDWGFCLKHSVYESMREQQYRVRIDSELKEGSLTYAEAVIPGETAEEVLVFTHICHPSLCNDNLSGIVLSVALHQRLAKRSNRYTYRFVFAPATIGSITWLARNEPLVTNIAHGLIVAVVGDGGTFNYKQSRRGNAAVDRAARHVLEHYPGETGIIEFSPYGYDERQFCSPGFNLPMGRLTRTPNGCYPEYHTSADNLQLVKGEYLAESLDVYLAVIDVLEGDRRYLNRSPKGEPQLGKRGLYHKRGGYQDISDREHAYLWVLNMSDGTSSLLDVAERSNLPFSVVADAAAALQECGLLQLVQ